MMNIIKPSYHPRSRNKMALSYTQEVQELEAVLSSVLEAASTLTNLFAQPQLEQLSALLTQHGCSTSVFLPTSLDRSSDQSRELAEGTEPSKAHLAKRQEGQTKKTKMSLSTTEIDKSRKGMSGEHRIAHPPRDVVDEVVRIPTRHHHLYARFDDNSFLDEHTHCGLPLSHAVRWG